MSNIAQAENWLKTVISGQPLNRDDLGEEDESSGTLRGISPVALKLAPQLQQQLAQELQNAPAAPAPTFTPPTLGLGGGRSGLAGGPSGVKNMTPKPPTDSGKDQE